MTEKIATLRGRKLKTADVVWLAGVTHMTIYNWRAGAARKTRPLPCDIGENGEVSFGAVALRAWAKENGVTLKMDPVEYSKTGKPQRSKPGPKPRTTEPKDGVKEAKPKARDAGNTEARRARTTFAKVGPKAPLKAAR